MHPQTGHTIRPVFHLAHHAKGAVGQRQHFLQQDLERGAGRGAGDEKLLGPRNRLQKPVLAGLQYLPRLQRMARCTARQDFLQLGGQGQQILLGSILHHEISKPMAQGPGGMRLFPFGKEHHNRQGRRRGQHIVGRAIGQAPGGQHEIHCVARKQGSGLQHRCHPQDMPFLPRGFQCQAHGLGTGIIAFNQQNGDGHGLLSSTVRAGGLHRPGEKG